MYPVSEAYRTMIQEPSRRFYWTGTITARDGKEYPFQGSDIVKGSGYITRQCSGSSEIELGTVYSAELGLSLFSSVDRYTLEDAAVSLFFHLRLADGSVEPVPMGIFYVAEANRQLKTLELKAYDAMLDLDAAFQKGLSSAFPYDFLTLLSAACKVELAQSREEIEALTNGTELFGIDQENDIETWRDFLHYLAQALGCFATIDRFGKLLLVPYGVEAVKTVDSRHRFTSSFSDFVTRYTALSVTNRKKETAEYYAKEPDNGLTMNLGVNPLLQFGLEETRQRIFNGILDAISIVEYVPFDSDTIGDPALDLGDVLKFTGGQADETRRAAITSITTKINGRQTIKCVGKNPRLREAKSKTDKNISGLLNSIGENRLSIYTFVNALALEVGSKKCSIINMEFASGDETNAEFHAEAVFQIASTPVSRSLTAEASLDLGPSTDEDGNPVENKKTVSLPLAWNEDGRTALTVSYVLDGHEIEQFHPLETWSSGNHLLNLYYPIVELDANQLHTFEVLISMSGGTAHIAPQNIMATISGQGLGVQERWDGRITADDTLPRITLSPMRTHTLREMASVHFVEPKRTGLSDGLASILLTGMALPPLRDELRMFSPIVRDVVEPADRKKMAYSKAYVLDEESFTLRQNYAVSGGTDIRLDRGRMDKLVIPTAAFEELLGVTILPFETLPFVSGYKLPAADLTLTEYTAMEDGQAVLKTTYEKRISGVDMEIDRGRLAVFPLGLDNMETVEHLEVQNA